MNMFVVIDVAIIAGVVIATSLSRIYGSRSERKKLPRIPSFLSIYFMCVCAFLLVQTFQAKEEN